MRVALVTCEAVVRRTALSPEVVDQVEGVACHGRFNECREICQVDGARGVVKDGYKQCADPCLRQTGGCMLGFTGHM